MEWTDINKKLPRNGDTVLVYGKDYRKKPFWVIGTIWKDNGEWHFTYCDVDGFNRLDDSQVTHWMPLPPKP